MIFGWYFVVYFAIPPSFRHNMYLALPSWWEEYDTSRIIDVATAPCFLYNSRDVIFITSQERSTVLSITVSDNVVLFCLRFLFSARYGVFWHDGDCDTLVSDIIGVLVPLSS